MAHSEKQQFIFGTLRINVDVLKARAGELETTDDIYTHQEIVGINEIHFDANVGGEPDWQPLDENTDLHELFAHVEKLQNEIKGLRMHNGRLKRKIETMGLVADTDSEER